MTKQRQQTRAKKRKDADASLKPPVQGAKAVLPEKGMQTPPETAGAPARAMPDFRRIVKTGSFRFAAGFLLSGFIVIALSQSIPHDYGFMELGWLFTLSIYDLVLAMLGLAVACAMTQTARGFRAITGTFLAVLLVMLFFFDPIFALILKTPLGDTLYLVAPAAVILTGASLWLNGVWRERAAMVAAGVVAFSFSLFIGLDDLGIGIVDFASGAVFCAIWLVLAPALLLRQFRGPWLNIPARIVGSWLVVIGIIVLGSLYVPMPVEAPALPDSSVMELVVPEDGSAPTLNGDELPLDGTGQ
ncbi:MAG TPA: hypothetical protein DIC56_06265 [Rhizobium sp.]|nr:hypothetical protein [Rhizobium sp.]